MSKSTPRNIKVQTPGEPAAPVGDAAQIDPADKPDTGADEGQAGQAAPSDPAPTAEELAAALAEIEDLKAQIAAAHGIKQSPAQTTAAAQPGRARRDMTHLRAHEIDPNKLSHAVLSKDGWVVPPAIKQAKAPD